MKNLLIVEDNPHTLSGLVTLLGDEGYEVNGVMQGNEALALAGKKPVDLVLCDYNLPDIEGLQACRELRRIKPQAVFFMTTASADEEIFDMASRVGVKKIFHKPINIDELFKTLLIASTGIA